MKTDNIYFRPIPKVAVTLVVRDNPSHQGPYMGSVDFAVPVGTTVLAANAGTVVRVRDDSDQYGIDPKYGQAVNYITIEHENGELSEYLHLAKQSATVHKGEKVKALDVIAKTGLSGWMTTPHLHFMVYKANGTFQCLEIQFKK